MSTKKQTAGPAFWTGALIGIAIMLFGLRGVITNARATRPFEFTKWLIGADLVHDLLIAPAACIVGALVARLLPRPWRGSIRAGLVASAIVLAVGWAPLRGYGRTAVPDNPTVQPINYATAVITVLTVVWLIVLAWLTIVALRRARTT